MDNGLRNKGSRYWVIEKLVLLPILKAYDVLVWYFFTFGKPNEPTMDAKS